MSIGVYQVGWAAGLMTMWPTLAGVIEDCLPQGLAAYWRRVMGLLEEGMSGGEQLQTGRGQQGCMAGSPHARTGVPRGTSEPAMHKQALSCRSPLGTDSNCLQLLFTTPHHTTCPADPLPTSDAELSALHNSVVRLCTGA